MKLQANEILEKHCETLKEKYLTGYTAKLKINIIKAMEEYANEYYLECERIDRINDSRCPL